MCWLKSYLSRAVFVSDSEIFISVSLRITEGKHSILYLCVLLVMTKMRETQRQIWLLNAF